MCVRVRVRVHVCVCMSTKKNYNLANEESNLLQLVAMDYKQPGNYGDSL